MIWLNDPALAAHNPVPTQVATIIVQSIGAPPHKKPAPEVTTTNELKRNLVKSAYKLSLFFFVSFDPLVITADVTAEEPLILVLKHRIPTNAVFCGIRTLIFCKHLKGEIIEEPA